MTNRRISSLFIALLSCAMFTACSIDQAKSPTQDNSQARKVITKKDDMPRHRYQIDIPVVQLYEPQHRDKILSLAKQVGEDLEKDLASLDIQDNSTLQGLYADLGQVAILQERWQDYLDLIERRRQLESKESNRLTMGLTGEVIARANLENVPDKAEYVQRTLAARLADMPYELIQDYVKSAKGSTEVISRNLVMGSMDSRLQPIVDSTGGEISYEVATRLLSSTFTLEHYIPLKEALRTVYVDYLDANKQEKANIWPEREHDLQPTDNGKPVTVAVWDSGIDVDALAGEMNLWRNDGEIADNGIDDDANGFVDDVHGIAWSLHSDRETNLLFEIGELGAERSVMLNEYKGLSDVYAAIDSDEAAAFRRKMASLSQDDVKDFIESLNIFGNYAHGSHVSGIAMTGNPFARLLTVRITFGHTIIPEEPTVEQAHKDAAAALDTVAYMQANGVRAVNMSWGGSLSSIESALEANGAGGDEEQRKTLAREIFSIGDKGLRDAIAGAPDILFITSAGNSDNDVKFDEFYPSSYEFPNILSVGAVDQAGEETSFTSLGKVEIYANGFEVESFVPGGDLLKMSGTSMASPQVLNLVAKLLATNPALNTQELRALVLDAADRKQLAEREILLLNPKQSFALLAERHSPPSGP